MTTKSRAARNENAKRLERAVHSEAEVAQQWCAENGVLMSIKNDGNHWSFWNRHGLVEWWPSTGKCVANKLFRKSRSVSSWTKIIPILVGELDAEPMVPDPVIGRTEWRVESLYDPGGEYADIPLEECPFDLV